MAIRYVVTLIACLAAHVASAAEVAPKGVVSGQLRQWQAVTVTFDGPQTGEAATPNPFTDYRIEVTFKHGDKSLVVPGYYAADGNAANSGATEGNKWRVHFVPDQEGEWSYVASFRSAPGLAVSDDPKLGSPCAFDGAAGSFKIEPVDKKAPGFLAKGMLRYVGEHYLRFAQTGEYFIKGGADSPENFLAYYEFDGTKPSHKFAAHAGDWREGDPTWAGGKGKNIIGALNYLAESGMNSVYMITMTVKGDGKDVWPWTEATEFTRFDCSKLDQWEIVFSHMDRLGVLVYLVHQEQENDQLLDNGDLGPARKLYYRELIARFSHHLALAWNMGEENTNSTEQRKDFSKFIRDLDPYDHPILVHTFPGHKERVYRPLLGIPSFDGVSLQANPANAVQETLKWHKESEAAGRKWFSWYDEQTGSHGVKPDSQDPNHDAARTQVLWPILLAGAGGLEWFFENKNAYDDLACDEWRSRRNMWDQTRYALEFFKNNLPFNEMVPANDLTAETGDCVLAKHGEVYAIFLPQGGSATLKLPEASGPFVVRWFDPRHGGKLQDGTVKKVEGGAAVSLGNPPQDADKDWVVLVQAAKK